MTTTRARSPTVRSSRGLVRLALSSGAIAIWLASQALAESTAITDLSDVQPNVIEVGDIVEAVAVQRGTEIVPKARLPVLFEANSVELRPGAYALLEKIGKALASVDLEPFRFSIEWESEETGSPRQSPELEQRRAALVRSVLIAQGFTESRIGRIGVREAGAPSGTAIAMDSSEDSSDPYVELINIGLPL